MVNDMDILFIYPPFTVDERYARSVGNVGGNLPPLGIAALAAFVREKGYKVDLLDAAALDMTPDDTISYISEKNPKIIGLSSLTATFSRTQSLAKNIKQKFPDKLILIGGHHASILPREVMQENNLVLLNLYIAKIIRKEIMTLQNRFRPLSNII
jgi:radical SAM superfamily enzyme YgiQ (UPF0313 family)